MSITELLFPKNRAEIGIIEVDASLRELHTSDFQITEHPIETGGVVVDHKIKRPLEIEMVAFFSDNPIAILNLFGDPGKSQNTWAELQLIQRANLLVTVVTTLQTYESMQIVSLSAPRNAQLGNSLEVTVRLREVMLVDSEEVEAPQRAQATTQAQKNQGKKPASPAEAPAATKGSSILLKLVGGVL